MVGKINEKNKWELKLVGLTDSDVYSNSFVVNEVNGRYVLTYCIYQPITNIRLLYSLKNILGYGKVLKIENLKLAKFIISDRKVLKEKLFTIFDKYPCLTTKYFFYMRLKKAWYILENKNQTVEQKIEAIENLLNKLLPCDYVSPAIVHLNDKSSLETIRSAISKYWLVGFIEGKGNFLISYEHGLYKVEFFISVNTDKILLNHIKRIFHISNAIISEQNGWLLKTKNNRAILNIIKFFSIKDCKFKGINSLYFKLWTKAFYYQNLKVNKVVKIYKIIQKLHNK